MAHEFAFWAAVAVAAAFAGLAASWWDGGRFVRGRSAVLAAALFLAAGAAGGFFLRKPLERLPVRDETERAEDRAAEMFRTDGLLRALGRAEPEAAGRLRDRFVGVLSEVPAAEVPAAKRRLRLSALRVALAGSLARLPNASDEAAARLAQALLAALSSLAQKDPRLGLGLLHPAAEDPAFTESALAALPDSERQDLESAAALTLASSVIRPHAAPWPQKADAALEAMFRESQPEFRKKYGGPGEVQALLQALADPAKAAAADPRRLCAFARDLLAALLRMPLEVRGPGLRRLLGSEYLR